jgi:hypothetical protein
MYGGGRFVGWGVNQLTYCYWPVGGDDGDGPSVWPVGGGNTSGGGDTTAPSVGQGSVNRVSDTQAAIGFTASEAGWAYYTVKDANTPAPTSIDVRNGVPIGSVTTGANSGKKVITLTAGTQDIYVVVQDAAGNLSAPLKIAAAAYSGGDGGGGTGGSPTAWTAITDSTFGPSSVTAIAYGSGKFVAVGSGGEMAYSPDGVTWTAVTDSTFGPSSVIAIAYGSGKFVAV